MKKQLLCLCLFISFVSVGCSEQSKDKEDAGKDDAIEATQEDKTSKEKVETSTETVQETETTTGPGGRAVERWQSLIKGDWDKAYSYETPGYRESYSVHDMRDSYGGAVVWKSIKLIGVEEDEKAERADVNLELISLFIDSGGMEMEIPSLINERWLLKDGQWWYVRK